MSDDRTNADMDDDMTDTAGVGGAGMADGPAGGVADMDDDEMEDAIDETDLDDDAEEGGTSGTR